MDFFHWLDYLYQPVFTKAVTQGVKNKTKQNKLKLEKSAHDIIMAQMHLGSIGNCRTEPAVIARRVLDWSVKSLGPADSVHC